MCGPLLPRGNVGYSIAGAHSMSLGLCPTKLPVTWEARADHPCVPALLFLTVDLPEESSCRVQKSNSRTQLISLEA